MPDRKKSKGRDKKVIADEFKDMTEGTKRIAEGITDRETRKKVRQGIKKMEELGKAMREEIKEDKKKK